MKDKLIEVESLLKQATTLVQHCTHQITRFELLETATELVEIEWHDRSETPPQGWLWMSDGYGLWMNRSFGEPIPDTATAVKYWAISLIPKPPKLGSDSNKEEQ